MGKTALKVKEDPRDIQLANCTLTAKGIVFQGELTFDEWKGVGNFLERAESGVQWWIGDWLNYGEGRPEYGDKYDQEESMFGRDYKTLSEYKSVARTFKFPDRSGNLPWTHYQVLCYAPPKVAKRLLSEAEPDGPNQPPKLSKYEIKKEAKRIRAEMETPALPSGKYRVVYADPPWKYNDERTGTIEAGSAVAQYELLETDCICALHARGRSVQDLAAKDAVLFLWVTSPMLPDGLRVMASWGFAYKSQFMWNKVRTYNGHYNAVGHELLLVGVRGNCQPDNNEKLHDSVVTIERTAHSKKPDEFYGIIESMYTRGPYIELFARGKRQGWTAWGNEA